MKQRFIPSFARLGALEPEVRLWLKILQCFGKFQPLESKRRCPALWTEAD
jgi:hypothetical protein